MSGKIIIVILALVIVGAGAFLFTRTGSDPVQTPEAEIGKVQPGAPTARPTAPAASGSAQRAVANDQAAPAPSDNMTRQRIEMLTAALKFAAERQGEQAPGTAPAGAPVATGTEDAAPTADQPGAADPSVAGGAHNAQRAGGQAYRGAMPTGVAGAPGQANAQAPTQAEMADATANLDSTDRELALLMGQFMSSPEKMQQMTTYFDQLSKDNPNMSKAQILEALKIAPFNQ